MKQSTRVRVTYRHGYCTVQNDKGAQWKFEYKGIAPSAGVATVVGAMLTETVCDCLRDASNESDDDTMFEFTVTASTKTAKK